MSLLEVSRVSKQGESRPVLQSVSFTQRRFQKIAIAGETGSGKSTLLKIIAGLAQPDDGEVTFGNEKVKGPAEKLVPGHPEIAYLSQHFELPGALRVEQVLSYANVLSEEAARNLYAVCQIDHLLHRRTDELSGGERQRIALTRLLISSPKLLLLDEPFSNLDRGHEHTLESVIQTVGKKLKITLILVSHEPLEILSWADKILVMRDGQIVQKGPPEKIYRQPVNQYVAGLFGKYNLLSADQSTLFLRKGDAWINKKTIMVRPESFHFVARGKGAPGKVVKSDFFGSYYEVEVLVKEVPITIKSLETFSKDDKVFVSLDQDRVWFI